MLLYDVAVFVHIMGVVSLFGGLILFQHAGARLRRARTWEDARLCLAFLTTVPGMMFGGPLFLLVSGLYMAKARWTFEAPWIAVGMIAVVAALVIGGLVTLPAVRRLSRVAGDRVGPVADADRVQITSSAMWPAMFMVNGVALAMVWVMSTKPGWVVSAGLPLVLGAIGLAAGMAVRGRAVEHPVVRGKPATTS